MNTHIILLRGVMPTGKNKVLMAPLRCALEEAGLSAVRTYIQSGNIVAATDLPQADLETLVHDVIRNTSGGDIKVLARPASRFKEALEHCPFKDTDTTKLYVTLLAREPERALLGAFLEPDYTPDRIEIIGDVAYTLCAKADSGTKIDTTAIERNLKVSATTRVYRTIARLTALSEV